MERHASIQALPIRPATEADLPEILDLLRQVDLIVEGVEDHLPAFLVATDGARVVGSTGLEVYGDVALLRSVAVATALRGRGLGRRLVATALVEARGRGVCQVTLLTTTAAPFFRRLGFQEVERRALDPRLSASKELDDECCATAVAMTLDLGAHPRSTGAATAAGGTG